MNKFHINTKGVVGRCRAEAGDCPFGGEDNHFGSIAEARVGYEKRMKDEEFATVSRDGLVSASRTDAEYFNGVKRTVGGTEEHDGEDALIEDYDAVVGVSSGGSSSDFVFKPFGLQELNKLVKDSENILLMRDAVERGSDRTLQNLAKNPNVPSDLLVEAYGKTSSDKVREALSRNENFPVSAMSGADYAKLLAVTRHHVRRDSLLKSEDVNDEHLDAIIDPKYQASDNFPMVQVLLRNPNNKISVDKLVQVAERNRSAFEVGAAQISGRYPADRIKDLGDEMIYWGNVSNPNMDSKYLKGYAEWAVRKDKEAADNPDFVGARGSYIASMVAGREDASPEVLKYLADNDLALEQVYNHKNATEKVKVAAAAKSETVARMKKLDDLAGGDRKDITKMIQVDSVVEHPYGNRGYAVTKVKFDVDKVKHIGLTREDIMLLMESRGYNAGASYDEKTGEFKGAVDSSG